jgi:hypothetical protein
MMGAASVPSTVITALVCAATPKKRACHSSRAVLLGTHANGSISFLFALPKSDETSVRFVSCRFMKPSWPSLLSEAGKSLQHSTRIETSRCSSHSL